MSLRATDDLPPFFDPDLIARVANLELLARQIVEGFLAGRRRSAFHGHSVEFAQHREYVAGDDLRHLDWKVWAKADRLYVKQFEGETNLRATLLLDISSSMDYGQGDRNKHQYACRMVAVLAYLLLRQSDSVGLVSFDETIRHETPCRGTRNHLRTILQGMLVDRTTRKTDPERVLRHVAEKTSKRGLLILVSDLLAKPEGIVRGLRLLRRRAHDVIVLHLMHDDELDFPFEGTTRFDGMESSALMTCDPRALRAGYLEAVARHRNALRRGCGHDGIDYRLVRTSESIDAVLASLLHERSRG